MNPDLVAYCDQVRSEQGLPDDILFRLLDDMAYAVAAVERLAPGRLQDSRRKWMAA